MFVFFLIGCAGVIVYTWLLSRFVIKLYRKRIQRYTNYSVYSFLVNKKIYILVILENIIIHEYTVILDVGNDDKFIINIDTRRNLIQQYIYEHNDKILLELQFYNSKKYYELNKISMSVNQIDPETEEGYALIKQITNKITIH